ncbi:MAG: carboxypeptidase-like regulatory domain-containing protein [Anaerolineales bacterium]
MKRNSRMLAVLILAALLFAGAACNRSTGAQVDVDQAVTQTLQALATIAQATLHPSGGETGAAAPTAAAAATEVPPADTPTATPTVAHVTIPSGPAGVASFMTDRSSAALASERRAIADNYEINLLERPFTSEVMDYKDYLDITRGELSLNPPFVYVTIQLEGSPPPGVTVDYGVEIDLDLDGHGDWLVTGQAPPDSSWTTDGVRACRDANNDVGGPTAMRVDAPNAARDGYEDCVFDSGYGIGPDEAWIRRDPSHANYIQVAFLFSLIGSDGEFLWGAWADEGLREPAWFDYQDHFTAVEAGSPASTSSEYPIKAVALLDNTCRWGYGFTPTGTEPGACYVPPTATPVPAGSISGSVYRGVSSSPTSERLSGVTVTLGSGSCPSSGLASTSTNSSGYYIFNNLPSGTYCVTVNKSTLPPASYGWGTMYPGGFPSPPGANPYHQVPVGPDEDVQNKNFAFLEIVG